MMPDSVGPGSAAMLTVVNVLGSLLPGGPVIARSSRLPSAALMAEPSTVSVMTEAPGSGLVKNSQANVPSDDGTMVAGRTAPLGSEAKKSALVSVAGSMVRENVTFGRKVT